MTTYRPKTSTPRTGSKCRLWIEERQAVTLAPTTTTEITDADIGLKPDTLAHQRAVDFVKAARGFVSHQAEKTGRPVAVEQIEIAVGADEIDIIEDADLLEELERLIDRPRPRWLDEMPPVTGVP